MDREFEFGRHGKPFDISYRGEVCHTPENRVPALALFQNRREAFSESN